ncbi:DAK2 domain-containing protein [Corynebacterium coyleae]|uniref:DAK2 domain-containing protein n=1 Tax=Corynebacterium coyleae TaxID=53374 RepID=UPI000C7841FF|nr:DAK2 domain-containing protein [Corynebacterium coyleae]PLA28741.1 kinase [Corynebacterium coyleae]
MSVTPLIDASGLLTWAQRAAGELDRRRVEINSLNVFPVPDSDTGSNMAHTMRSACEEAALLGDDATTVEVAEALAVGAVRGARGNSGVVLSQVIRGIAQSVKDDMSDGEMVADALSHAVRFVDQAIAEPVEGTVITVLRAAAVAAQQAVEDTGRPLSLIDVAAPATSAARVALANTPSQLPVLREAGVVDAGGTGVVILLEALLEEVGVSSPDSAEDLAEAHTESDLTSSNSTVHDGHSDAAHTVPTGREHSLEVLFGFQGDVEGLEAELRTMGDSLVIARLSGTEATVHIHSFDAGAVIETAYRLGSVSNLRLEVLPGAPVVRNPDRLIVAVTPPGSLTELYQQAGVVTVAPGDDVISDMLSVIRRSGSSEIIVLPNGLLNSRNLAAVEKATRALEQTITLLPTVRLVSGIAALSVHDPNQPLATAAFSMSEAAGEMRTAVAHRAERGALTLSGAVAKGDVVVSARGETLLIAEDPLDAVQRACKRLLEHGGEQVTVLFDPAELQEDQLRALEADLGVQVMVYPADGLQACAEIGVE